MRVFSLPERYGVGAEERSRRVNEPVTAADWAERMAALRDVKPRPLAKLYGRAGPTTEQLARWCADMHAWNREYRHASKYHKKALEVCT